MADVALVLFRSMPIRMTPTSTPASATSTPAMVWYSDARASRASMARKADAGASRMSEMSSGTTEINFTEARGRA